MLPGTLVCIRSVSRAPARLKTHLKSTKRKPAVRGSEMCDKQHALPPRPHRQVPIPCWRIVNELTGIAAKLTLEEFLGTGYLIV